MRFRDDLIRRGYGLPESRHLRAPLLGTIHDHLRSAIVIAVDEASDYFLKTHGPDEMIYLKEIPTWLPPFQVCFVETRHGEWLAPDYSGWGLLLITHDFYAQCEDEVDRVGCAHSAALEFANKNALRHATPLADIRFMVESYLFVDTKLEGPIGPIAFSMTFLDHNGGLVGGERDGETGIFAATLALADDPSRHEFFLMLRRNMEAPLMFGVALTHCKNVTMEERLPSRQERRAAERRGEPITKYRTLRIEPMKRALRFEGGIEQHGLKRALHICRGHFATYSDEKPLFGRIAGTFWIPQHVRGTAEVGVIEKDYEVNKPLGG